MKILISVDMEGITGVVDWNHVQPDHAEYLRFRRQMTEDVNAAIRGVFDAGVKEVLVTDCHARGNNLLIEELDPRVAGLNAGDAVPFLPVRGIEAGVSAALFVGYHARAGTLNAVLDHTWTGNVSNLWLNDTLVGETGLSAAMCGHFGVPVILIAGDRAVCNEASELLGPLEMAVVKEAGNRMAACCLPPHLAQETIYQAAVRAVNRLRSGGEVKPWRLNTPIKLTIEFARSSLADHAALLPGARRVDGRRVEYAAEDMPAAHRLFVAAEELASVGS